MVVMEQPTVWRLGATRRAVLWGAGAAAGAALAAACGVGQGASGQATRQVGKNHAPVKLTIWEHALFPWRKDVGKEITDPLLAENPWLTIDSSTPAGNIQEKFMTAAAAGTPPDAYTNGDYQVQQDFVDGGTLNLEKYLATSKVLKKADIWESLRRNIEFKGAMTGIPYAPDTRIFYTHDENAKKAGLDPAKQPTTWTDLREQAKKAFRGSPGTVEQLGWYPFMGSGGVYLWMVPYWQLGGETTNAEQTKVTFFNDKAIQALTWLKQVVDDNGGWTAIDAFRKTFPDTNGYTLFMAGGATFYHATLSERGEQFAIKAPQMTYNLYSYPLPDKGGTVANYGGCHCFAIAKGSAAPDVMFMAIEWFTRNDNNIKFALRYDRVPIRESSTSSKEYVGSDKGRALQAQEMKKRRFVIAAPGGTEMLPLQDVVTPFMSGQMSLADALQTREKQAQEVMDRYLAKSKTINP
jgi:multiple sugar transport system substrate-binding protein